MGSMVRRDLPGRPAAGEGVLEASRKVHGTDLKAGVWRSTKKDYAPSLRPNI